MALNKGISARRYHKVLLYLTNSVRYAIVIR